MKHSIGLIAFGILAVVVAGCNEHAASNRTDSAGAQAGNASAHSASGLRESASESHSASAKPSAQTDPVLVRNLDALLSEDPKRAKALEDSIAAFLIQAKTGDFTEDTIDPDELNRHGFFYRRVGGFGEKPGIGVPSVLKAYTLNEKDYFVTIAFMGETEGVPFLDMIVELKATPHGNGYRFHCPFEERTQGFHATTIEDVCFRYSGEFNEDRARQFVAKRSKLADLSGITLTPMEYFAFQSLDEMLKSYGLVFDHDRCNFLGHDLGLFDYNRTRYVTGMGDECYMYGYAWHFLRSPDHDRSERYHTMAVGFTTLFGGYWLIGTPMEELKKELRETIKKTPEIDLLDLFKKGRNGQTQGHAPSLVMAALICEQVLEKGSFQDLLRLVYSGSNGERFFDELGAILGIDEAGFRGAIIEMLNTYQATFLIDRPGVIDKQTTGFDPDAFEEINSDLDQLLKLEQSAESQVEDPVRSIPFRLTRWNNISVPAIVNKNFAINLMFHTASDQASLTQKTLDKLPEIELDQEAESKSWGGDSTIRFSRGVKLSVGPVRLDEIAVFQTTHSGHQTDGKIGPSQLQSHFIEIDFDRSEIFLHPTLPKKTSDWERLTITTENGMMFVEGSIHIGKRIVKQRFMIHSGYSGFALLDDEFVAKHSDINELEIIEESELTDAGGNKLKTKKASLPNFSIGDFKFDDVTVSFFGGSIGRQKFSVLGGDFLKRFNLVFDLENEALYLKKSRHFGADN